MIERCPNAGAAFLCGETTVAIEAVVITVAIVIIVTVEYL